MRMRAQVFLLQEEHSGDAQAACQPLVRPFRRATAPSRNPGKHGFWGPRPGPESGLGWASALRGYTLGIYLTPRHPNSHVTSRACPRDAHFMPSCMQCLHALRGRPVHTRIAPPRAPGRFSSRICVYVLPPMAGYPGGVRWHRITPPIPSYGAWCARGRGGPSAVAETGLRGDYHGATRPFGTRGNGKTE